MTGKIEFCISYDAQYKDDILITFGFQDNKWLFINNQ